MFIMRCVCCDKNLSDFESTRKSVTTNDYIDMCNKCYLTIKDDLVSIEREDLLTNEDTEDEENY